MTHLKSTKEMEVERYKYFDGANGIEENPNGEWVSYYDYQALKKQEAQLLKALIGLNKDLNDNHGYTEERQLQVNRAIEKATK